MENLLILDTYHQPKELTPRNLEKYKSKWEN